MIGKLRSAALAAAALFVMAAAGNASAGEARTRLGIDGMTCGGCVASVELQLGRTEGVTDYEVSLEDGEARVSYDPERTDPETIAASVSETGFEAHVEAEAKEPGTSR
jgi:copper chaperone CopZ